MIRLEDWHHVKQWASAKGRVKKIPRPGDAVTSPFNKGSIGIVISTCTSSEKSLVLWAKDDYEYRIIWSYISEIASSSMNKGFSSAESRDITRYVGIDAETEVHT